MPNEEAINNGVNGEKPDKKQILKNLIEEGWVSCNVQFGSDNQLVLYLAIGETIRQGKIVVPADTNPEMMGDLIVVDGADTGDGVED